MTRRLEADAIWDDWCAAREQAPLLSPEAFAHGYGDQRAEALSQLELLLAVEEQAPLPSLVRVLQPGADGQLRFAGFRLLQELGEGAAGIVFLAVDERVAGSTNRVAIKLLNPVLRGGRSSRETILHEAQITQQLDHASIVRVIGSGTEQGYAWIATELVEGDSLGAWIDEEVPAATRLERALDVGVQLSSALEHAHDRGILHRDLKPSNVMVGKDGCVKVLDFGLARREGAAFGVSRTGEVVGTPLYMAPEQLRGERDLDGRVDLYALGLILLELATGKRLHVQEFVLKAMARVARGDHRLPTRFLRGLPPGLGGVLSRCLEPDRRDRFIDARALTHDLLALQRGDSPSHKRIGALSRLQHQVVRRPLRSAILLVFVGLTALGLWWASNHTPITVTIDSIVRRPARMWIDGEEVSARLPSTHSFFRRGEHLVEFSDGTYRYPFEIDVRDEGPRSQFLPFGRVYSLPGPLVTSAVDLNRAPVSFLQFAVRATDRGEDEVRWNVRVRVDDGVPHAVGGFSHLLLGVRTKPYVIRVESDGHRSRELLVNASDGGTQSWMVELDRADSPWHTVVVGSPLDPALMGGVSARENLTLRWENAQRDGVTEGFVHRIGLGVVEGCSEGKLEFELALPCDVEELQLLTVANPGFDEVAHPTSALLVEMGPSLDELIPVLEWGNHPGSGPDPEAGYWNVWTPDTQERLSAAMREARSRSLYVRYRVSGAAAWALRTNALPRRTTRGIQWDPALVLRVRPPGSESVAASPQMTSVSSSWGKVPRRIDFEFGQDLLTFDASGSGDLVSFQGELIEARLAGGMDANGDGVVDFAFSIEGDSNHVEIRSGKDGSRLHRFVGEEGDDLGRALVFLPDLNDDGGAELLVGAPQGSRSSSDGPGYIRVFSGRTGETLAERSGRILHEGFGRSLDYVGDLDGRGRHAVVVSTDEREAGGWGSAMLLSLPDLREIGSWSGREQFDFFGNMCARAGDVNADGKPDFLIAALTEDAPVWDSGVVYVYSGDEGAGFPLLHRVSGDHAWVKLGGCVGPVGDLDLDGHDDWFATSSVGFTTVFSGRSGVSLRRFLGGFERVWATSATPRLVPDLDADGRMDFAVPTKSYPAPASHRNGTIVYSVATGQPLLEMRGTLNGAELRSCPAPDVDGDGHADLWVGIGRRKEDRRIDLVFVAPTAN